MSDRQYVHFGHRRSWHVIRIVSPAIIYTLCGRQVRFFGADLMGELPAAKSCETCLRIAKRQDEAPIDDDASTHDELVP